MTEAIHMRLIPKGTNGVLLVGTLVFIGEVMNREPTTADGSGKHEPTNIACIPLSPQTQMEAVGIRLRQHCMAEYTTRMETTASSFRMTTT